MKGFTISRLQHKFCTGNLSLIVISSHSGTVLKGSLKCLLKHSIAFLNNEFCSYGYFTSPFPVKFGYLKRKRYRRLFDLMGGNKTSLFSIS